MTPKRWQQIEKLYHESLKLEASRRSAFLDKACAGDEALRREVESLLAHQPQAESFIEAPALEVAAKGMAQNRAPSLVGRQVGPYKIHSLLGVGGMGEVYLAQDPRLDRAIALKILPLEFASDQDRLQRFVREARAASALNHANVAHIYEIGQSDGLHFIAMEYVEGQSLAQKMSGQPLELKEVLDIGIQAADALEEAHRKGITHRDIKPANLMITPKGQVKVLDFGLAKITRPESEAVGSDVSTSIHTAPGMVMGTLRYMSPEQVLGKELDARTDLFSLGVVLYEMTTGRLPFSASNASEVTDRILHAQPEAIARFNYNVPTELERIIRKCLEKDRERRYQSAHELLIDLKNLRRDSSHTTGNKAILVPRKSLHWIATAVLLLAVLLVIGIRFLMPTSQAISSIAVLPFANADADTNAEYLSDGISESLINSLSQLPKLKVMSRNSVFRYKGRESDAQTAGHELKVQAVLVGRVIQRGGNVTIKTELVNASDGSHIWGEEFTRNLSDIVTVQSDMAREISEKLRLKLTREEKNRLARRYTENVEAYHLYLKGRHYWNKRSGDELKKAILCFQQAIDLDPSYGLAYAGLAETYVLGAFPLPPSEKIPKAIAAAQKALQLDESLAQAHNSLARAAYMYDHNWQEGERGFRRAIELNPSYETAHHWYAEYLACLGRQSESIEEAKKALEVDPLSLVVNWILGNTLYLARQYPQAIEQYRKTLELDPGFSRARGALVEAYEQTGRYAEAISEAEKGAARSGQNFKEVLALRQAYKLSGVSGYWKQKTARALEESLKTYYSAMNIAYCYARLSEKDQALMWLDKAYAEHEQFLVQLNVHPVWDNLRSDPRFAAQVTRIGLVPVGQ